MRKDILFHASQLGKLMTEPKTKAAKEAGELSETTKSHIEEIWLENEYGYKEELLNAEIRKGKLCEQGAIDFVQLVHGGEMRVKNVLLFENSHLSGTPDIITMKEGIEVIEDIKCSFTVRTFFKAECREGDNYWWQGQAYMDLTGARSFRLIYVLMQTPENIVNELKKRVYFINDCDESSPEYKASCEQIEANHTISHIPFEKRIKIFEFGYDQEAIHSLYARIDKCREYYNSLEL